MELDLKQDTTMWFCYGTNRFNFCEKQSPNVGILKLTQCLSAEFRIASATTVRH